MRRLGQWTLNALTVLSLVLCVATCVLWAQSYWHTDYFAVLHRPSGRAVHLQSGAGTARLTVAHQYLLELFLNAPTFVHARDRARLGPVPLVVPQPGRLRVWHGFAWQVHEWGSPPDARAMVAAQAKLQALSAAQREAEAEDDWIRARQLRAELSHAIAAPLLAEWERSVYLPLWALALASGALPAWRGGHLVVRRLRRTRQGECASCGYDLTGNVSGVCPECGSAIKEGNA